MSFSLVVSILLSSIFFLHFFLVVSTDFQRHIWIHIAHLSRISSPSRPYVHIPIGQSDHPTYVIRNGEHSKRETTNQNMCLRLAPASLGGRHHPLLAPRRTRRAPWLS